jgi:predicted peptidase
MRLFLMVPLFKSIVFFIVCFPVIALAADPQLILSSSKSSAQALVYFSQSVVFKKQNLLIALHGLRQTKQETYVELKNVADELGAVLLCPQGSDFEQGYIRTPVDDRQIILEFHTYLAQKYQIKYENTIVLGFSRGGNFAVELGVLYPEKFKNIVCVFGFFNKHIYSMAEAKKKELGISKFLFITGDNDQSLPSLTNGYNFLQKLNVKVDLKVYKDLIHSYPPDLAAQIRAVFLR